MNLQDMFNALYPKHGGPRIDMWREQSYPGGSHTFGYWPNGKKACSMHPPEREVVIPILGNGNYPGNPSPEAFYTWIGKTRKSPELFTIEEYDKVFLN